MKVLITGASGQIGSYVLERFADKYNAVGADLKPYPIKDLKDLVILGDLRDYEFVRRLVRDIDAVIHLADKFQLRIAGMTRFTMLRITLLRRLTF